MDQAASSLTRREMLKLGGAAVVAGAAGAGGRWKLSAGRV